MKRNKKIVLAIVVSLLLLLVWLSPVQAQSLTVVTDNATSITSESATLNGNLTDMGGEPPPSAQVSFQWGTTTDYGNETDAEEMSNTGIFDADINGLSANTTYHFRAKAIRDGTTVYGADKSFIYLELEGWGWCPDYRGIADATLSGGATIESINSAVSRVNFSGDFTFDVPEQYDSLSVTFSGMKLRSLFYVGESNLTLFTGFWLEDSAPDYISFGGQIMRSQGTVLSTVKPYEFYLRTDQSDIPERSRDDGVAEFIIGRATNYVDQLTENLFTDLSFKEDLELVLAKGVVLFKEVKDIVGFYIP